MLWVGRIVVLIVSVVAFFIASSGLNSTGSWASNIMAMVENAWGLFGAAFGPVVILSLFWKRFNYAGAVAGIIAGAVADVVWLLTCTNAIISEPLFFASGVYEIVPGFIIGATVAVIVTLCTKAPGKDVENIFVMATNKAIDD